MKNIRYTWKRSLATLALFAAFGVEAGDTPAHAVSPSSDPPEATPAVSADVTNQATADPAQDSPPAATPSEKQRAPLPTRQQQVPRYGNVYNMDPRLARRYGLLPSPTPAAPTATPAKPSRNKEQVEAKLNEIHLDEVVYDGLPLTEIVRDLREQARKRDPEKRGINFLISDTLESGVGPGAIDPTTGQPLPSAPSVVPISDVSIKIRIDNVSVRELLDAIVRVTQPSIKYSVEEYGVVFSPAAPLPALTREFPPLQVRTFRVNTNTFLAGLESTFGIKVPRMKPSIADATTTANEAEAELKRAEQRPNASPDEKLKGEFETLHKKQAIHAATSPKELQEALRQLLRQLGIEMGGNKAVFYNDLTGILMVRATADDLQLIQAAIETLGGRSLVLNP